MDDRDVHEIANRVRGSSRVMHGLDTLSTLYQSGSVPVPETDFAIPLTAAQKAAIKTRFTAGVTRARALAVSLPIPTGVAGVVDVALRAEVESQPPRINQLLADMLNVLAAMPEPTEQPDGTVRVLIDPENQQSIANFAATTRDCLNLVYALMAARMT